MSMLAERRRKQKWAVDPRNTAWSNDDSKFGQRMLEKMGWSKGKGLGAQEQGATDPIRVQVKNNHLGLGARVNHEDNWIAHQDDFNQLLAELNTCHGQETADSSDNKEKKSFSLEEKSKISKNRVHYMKFTKGKDLSSRSKTDLDCVFGKRQSKKTLEDNSSPSTPDGNETSTTTTSAFTIQEYFTRRMAELKSKPQVTAPGPVVSDTQVEPKKGKKRNKKVTGENVESYTQPGEEKHEEEENQKHRAKKKKAARRQQPRQPCRDEDSDGPAEAAEECDDPDLILKPKKRTGKKKLQKPGEVPVDLMLAKTPVKKKKKKKKGSR
ncbi:PIN2/TERF1-interacting telomerase inhibitor 1 isoform X2 [Nycticebus coucang]|uniref:PIN2/TERF1-interacting telomerase inhibitor 1 isoform X2 n=1 Tax=Nycticebus coucang TaxID=9470 RepID=UPI00234D8DF3|nr:PIN2/TERF1-interacting telomerase inhibitor 1 isoform X2 [Nycticebus coucang]